MYAIIECGGKQYRVQEGDLVRVEKLAVEVGSNYTTDKVLLIGGDNKTMVGTPYVPGYVVTGKILNHDKDKKVLVFHYKAKKNIRVRYGHRQPFTSLLIEQIQKGKVEPVETKTEKVVAKTAKVEVEAAPEKNETKAQAVVKAAPTEAEVKAVKTTKAATSTAKAKTATSETAAKTVKTAKPKADSTKAASAAKPAAAKAVKTAKAETAATKTTKTTKAKSPKTEKTEA